MRTSAWLMLLAACVLITLPARADVTSTDLQVIARALSFMENAPRGALRVGIVHTPGNPASSRQANEMRATLGNGFRVGNIELRPVMVSLDDAAGANVDVFFLTEHIGPSAKSLAAVSAARRMPCVTVDITQVRDGACVMGVRSRPRVEIVVNRAAASDSGVAFATAFRMMITEL